MSVLPWRPRTRILLLSFLIVLLAAATAVFGGGQSAQAFDCTSVVPKPVGCPFLKISQQGTPYKVEAKLFDPGNNVLYTWNEERENFTLWHWRWWQAEHNRVRGFITPLDNGLPVKEFDFPASQTHCFLVNGQGVNEVTTDCNDNEDPAK